MINTFRSIHLLSFPLVYLFFPHGEELVFINGKLSAGIEYYTHTKYPFLEIPRSFEIQNIERIISNYENIKFTSSLIKYMPKLKKATFKLRVYKHKDSEFYILKSNLQY